MFFILKTPKSLKQNCMDQLWSLLTADNIGYYLVNCEDPDGMAHKELPHKDLIVRLVVFILKTLMC